MRRSNCTALFGLVLSLLASQAATSPVNQFGQTLNSTVDQLGLLANAGYNTQSFAQLSSLLANLFGSMMTLSEPYFNSFISQALAQNAATLQKIIELENTSNAAASVVYNLLNSASATLGSSVAAIGGSLFQFQNTANSRLYGLQNAYNSNQTVLNQMSAAIPQLNALIASTHQTLQQAQQLIPQLIAAIDTAYESVPVLIILTGANLTLTAGSDSKCATVTVILLAAFELGPVVHHTVAVYPWLVGSESSVGPFYDANFITVNESTVVVEICTRNASAILPLPRPIVLQLATY